jgi:hypothetical protein
MSRRTSLVEGSVARYDADGSRRGMKEKSRESFGGGTHLFY